MKKLYVVASFLVVLTAGLLWMRRPAQAQSTTDEPYYTFPIDDVIMGYKISPVPITIGNRNPFRVGWGSYLVNAVAGCNDCHTMPSFADGGNPYMGQPTKINAAAYLGGGRAFGPFTSRNLTPEANGMPSGLTLDQFTEAMTKGTDFDKKHPQMGPLLQVMPWPTYQNMSTRQIRAIYEYLSSIPPVTVPGLP